MIMWKRALGLGVVFCLVAGAFSNGIAGTSDFSFVAYLIGVVLIVYGVVAGVAKWVTFIANRNKKTS